MGSGVGMAPEVVKQLSDRTLPGEAGLSVHIGRPFLQEIQRLVGDPAGWPANARERIKLEFDTILFDCSKAVERHAESCSRIYRGIHGSANTYQYADEVSAGVPMTDAITAAELRPEKPAGVPDLMLNAPVAPELKANDNLVHDLRSRLKGNPALDDLARQHVDPLLMDYVPSWRFSMAADLCATIRSAYSRSTMKSDLDRIEESWPPKSEDAVIAIRDGRANIQQPSATIPIFAAKKEEILRAQERQANKTLDAIMNALTFLAGFAGLLLLLRSGAFRSRRLPSLIGERIRTNKELKNIHAQINRGEGDLTEQRIALLSLNGEKREINSALAAQASGWALLVESALL